MGLSRLLPLLVLVWCAAGASNGTKTKTVVLMLENRSFSHLLGFLRKELTGKEFNRCARRCSFVLLTFFQG
jgi:phospholipase C